jgi:hypothetical protein
LAGGYILHTIDDPLFVRARPIRWAIRAASESNQANLV